MVVAMIAKKLRSLVKPPAEIARPAAPAPRTRIRTRAAAGENDPSIHPWRQLTAREDRVVQTSAGKESEYLATPEIRIVSKKEAVPHADGGRASYAFKLNAAPDMFWRHRFAKNLEDLPDGINRSDLRVEFDADTLLLLCMPTRLEAKYACVKANVARTNADYQRERQLVLERLRREADGKDEGDSKAEIVQRRFDRLEL